MSMSRLVGRSPCSGRSVELPAWPQLTSGDDVGGRKSKPPSEKWVSREPPTADGGSGGAAGREARLEEDEGNRFGIVESEGGTKG